MPAGLLQYVLMAEPSQRIINVMLLFNVGVMLEYDLARISIDVLSIAWACIRLGTKTTTCKINTMNVSQYHEVLLTNLFHSMNITVVWGYSIFIKNWWMVSYNTCEFSIILLIKQISWLSKLPVPDSKIPKKSVHGIRRKFLHVDDKYVDSCMIGSRGSYLEWLQKKRRTHVALNYLISCLADSRCPIIRWPIMNFRCRKWVWD